MRFWIDSRLESLDRWSLFHFAGSGLLSVVLMAIFGLRPFWATLLVTMAGFLWELLDYYASIYDWKIVFDNRGASKWDLGCDIFGALLFSLLYAVVR